MEYSQLEFDLPVNNFVKNSENNAIESIAKQLQSIEEQKKSLFYEISNFLPSSVKQEETSQSKLVQKSMKLMKKNEQILKTIESPNDDFLEEEPIEFHKPLDFKLSELSTTIGDDNSEGRVKESFLYKQMTSFLFSIPNKQALKFLGQASPRSEQAHQNPFTQIFRSNKSEDALAEQLSAMVGQIDWEELANSQKLQGKKAKQMNGQSKRIKKNKQSVNNKRKFLTMKNKFEEINDSDAIKQLLQETMPNFDENNLFQFNSLDDNNDSLFKQTDQEFNDLFSYDCISNCHPSINDEIAAPIMAEDLIISKDQQKKFQDPIQHDYESQKILDLYSHISVIEQMLNQTKEQLSLLLQ